MIIDIDGLKTVNDTPRPPRRRQPDPPDRRDPARAGAHHRHRRPPLRRRVRGADAADRHGGGAAARRGPARAGRRERLRRRPMRPASRSASGSRCSAADRGVGAEAVLVAADQAMYRAKEEGRNQIALFQDPDEPQRHPRRGQTTTARIRDALTHDRLSLHTQPIRSLASGGIERYELLLRMTGDNGELLPAASFIEVAERSGMIQELDRWVVARALELLADRERGGQTRSPCTSTSPAPRSPTSRCSSSSSGDSTRATPIRRAAPSRSPRPRRSTTTRRRPASPTASPSSAARSRSTTTAPASGPSTTSSRSPST